MKVAVAAMALRQGDCEANVKRMKKDIQMAKQAHAQLIVFPQNAVSGYPLGDLWLDRDFCRYADHYNEEIAALADEIAIVWGNVRYRGGCCFNTAFFAYQGQLELRVRPYQGTLYNDARYFEMMEHGTLIEYQDELIALNFHDDLELATINITLDASLNSCLPKGATQIYVNAGGCWQDARGYHILDARCFVTQGSELYHFSEYTNKLYICDTTAPIERIKCDQKQRVAYLLDEVQKRIGGFTLSEDEQFLQTFAERFQRTWLLQRENQPCLQLFPWCSKSTAPALFCDFTIAELLEAKVIETLDQLSLEEIILAFYEQTRSIKGVCYWILQYADISERIQCALRDPDSFIDQLIIVINTYQQAHFFNQADLSQMQLLKSETQKVLEELQKTILFRGDGI